MTQDTDGIIKANELLQDPETTVEELRAAQDGISSEMRTLNAQQLPDVAQATSMAQRREFEAQRQEVGAMNEILSNLFRRLGDAIQRRRAQDAIEGAEGDRAALEKALELAETARAAYLAAAKDALDCADVIAKGRQAAGHTGFDKVGATAAQVDKLQDLAEPLLEVAALQRLRLTTQLGDPRKVA
ncbi:hypothetical protein [Halomonas sp. PGE1]|uniref:hypothetical protein n=1 Tax=Halomonas sp. PGE1 TaxID=2730360 RepID=UPI0014745B8B|nr:hypothetical protein [Halomonas sp. PGE1]QJQ98921.1 hypothetical protein HIR79_09595 [Halomonas sp. PGE1]